MRPVVCSFRHSPWQFVSAQALDWQKRPDGCTFLHCRESFSVDSRASLSYQNTLSVSVYLWGQSLHNHSSSRITAGLQGPIVGPSKAAASPSLVANDGVKCGVTNYINVRGASHQIKLLSYQNFILWIHENSKSR